MAKRQKCMRIMLYKNSQSDNSIFIYTSSLSKGCTSHPGITPLEIVVSMWKDAWYSKLDWIEFNFVTCRVFCKVCRQKGCRSTFATMGSINIRISTFQEQGKSAKHGRLTWAMQIKKRQWRNVLQRRIEHAMKPYIFYSKHRII